MPSATLLFAADGFDGYAACGGCLVGGWPVAVLAAIARPAAARRNGGYCGRLDVFASEECWRKELIRGGTYRVLVLTIPREQGSDRPSGVFQARGKLYGVRNGALGAGFEAACLCGVHGTKKKPGGARPKRRLTVRQGGRGLGTLCRMRAAHTMQNCFHSPLLGPRRVESVETFCVGIEDRAARLENIYGADEVK